MGKALARRHDYFFPDDIGFRHEEILSLQG